MKVTYKVRLKQGYNELTVYYEEFKDAEYLIDLLLRNSEILDIIINVIKEEESNE
jgi:hypothetical protein